MPHILSNLQYFFQNRKEELWLGDIIVINCNTSLVSGMYKLKDSLLFKDIDSSHPFLLWYCHYFTGALEAIHYVKGIVFISQRLRQPSIKVSSPWLIRENLKSTVFIWGKQLYPGSFKGAYLFHKISCSNLCLQSPHTFIMNVLIWQIWFYWFELAAIPSICSKNVYSLWPENKPGQR